MLHTKWNSIDKYGYSSHVTYTGAFSILVILFKAWKGRGNVCVICQICQILGIVQMGIIGDTQILVTAVESTRYWSWRNHQCFPPPTALETGSTLNTVRILSFGLLANLSHYLWSYWVKFCQSWKTLVWFTTAVKINQTVNSIMSQVYFATVKVFYRGQEIPASIWVTTRF